MKRATASAILFLLAFSSSGLAVAGDRSGCERDLMKVIRERNVLGLEEDKLLNRYFSKEHVQLSAPEAKKIEEGCNATAEKALHLDELLTPACDGLTLADLGPDSKRGEFFLYPCCDYDEEEKALSSPTSALSRTSPLDAVRAAQRSLSRTFRLKCFGLLSRNARDTGSEAAARYYSRLFQALEKELSRIDDARRKALNTGPFVK